MGNQNAPREDRDKVDAHSAANVRVNLIDQQQVRAFLVINNMYSTAGNALGLRPE